MDKLLNVAGWILFWLFVVGVVGSISRYLIFGLGG